MGKRVICTVCLCLVCVLAQSPAWAQGNQIVNSEFDDGTNGWGRYGTTGFDFGVVQGVGFSGANAALIDVTDASATAHIGIAQSGLLLESGKTYPIGFTARAGQAREMVVLLQTNVNNAGWADPLTQRVDLTTAAETYVIEYTHTGDTFGDDPTEGVDLYLMLKGPLWPMGGDDLNAKVWIDRVYFGEEPPLPRRDLATKPSPEDGATDVERDIDLGWVPGAFAQTHDVYLGTVFDDVNTASRTSPMDILLSQGQSAAAFDFGRLAFDQTYYWRVDEVNGLPDNAVIKGTVWSFTTEPLAYPIADVVATSNALSNPNEGPVNAVDGSGLDANDLHSTATREMWLGSPDAEPVYIQFEFDQVYKLYEMLVWNYNAEVELFLGFGLKDVTVEYSQDGAVWTTLGEKELAQATSKPDYAANTTIEFAGAAARYVRLTVNSGWGTLNRYGLSEVRFLYIPVHARHPEPSDGATDVDVNTSLTWRSGRDTTMHEVFLSTDSDAVADGTALVDTIDQSRYTPGNLEFGNVYYWKVDEVNEAEAVTSWEGGLWSFAVQEYATIEGFEAYDDDDNLIYEAWVDGWVNGTGSTVGYLEAPFAEISIVHGGGQSMPLEYYNAESPFYSEAESTWTATQDWTIGGADSLRLYFHGNLDNAPDTLYVALEDSAGHLAVVRHEDSEALGVAEWQEWSIPLGAFSGVNMATVKKMVVGVGDPDNPTSTGAGLIYIDDIQFGHALPVAEPEESAGQ